MKTLQAKSDTKAKRQAALDKLHLEYERLLTDEIESLIGIAIVHGWQSRNVVTGARIRAKLKLAGSQIVIPESDACLMASVSTAAST